jgi:hypothetical protein
MRCPICQETVIESPSLQIGYCEVFVNIGSRVSQPHYEFFVPLFLLHEQQPHQIEVLRTPPFTIYRRDNGGLSVICFKEPDKYRTVLEQQDTTSEDFLNCYYRFKNLRAFL